MKTEALLFSGVAAFFAVVSACYVPFSRDTAGNAALLVAFLMSALIAFFLWIQYLRHGTRAQDRPGADVHEGAGPVAFFPPRSYYPVLTALGTTVAAFGVIYGMWLFLIGIGITAPGVAGFVFQHNDR
ncbi:hypothetical protein DB35_28300 [Streptomyces abyssalis]|uniref:cytochrome-c oxidase n=1 Tax=Streptomyces abyssalis TaxID=933944 RepID=A0A1E7JJP4_9ACTN|nr:cytochrome c oxidase subunit 4 [Streptomyces abyssalis]OEU87333.1 hypothetical protein DB35_28300 [Streptomyces abyssalis]OEU87864.1 hypothetical protein AN215_16380 [Streptomyces abyssalis]OEV29879.1 hypothetical protein AN219_14030 [Streptomyces nanshensis]